MGCPYCDSESIGTNGTAGWCCYDCEKYFDEPQNNEPWFGDVLEEEEE